MGKGSEAWTVETWMMFVRVMSGLSFLGGIVGGIFGFNTGLKISNTSKKTEMCLLCIYWIGMSILGIIAEARWEPALWPFSFLTTYVGRALYSIFIGTSVIIIGNNYVAAIIAGVATLVFSGIMNLIMMCFARDPAPPPKTTPGSSA